MIDTCMKKMESSFSDEMQDSRKYYEMAKEADASGDEELAESLLEMCHDEFTHAQFIHDCIIQEGHSMTDAQRQMWNELDSMMGNIF